MLESLAVGAIVSSVVKITHQQRAICQGDDFSSLDCCGMIATRTPTGL